MGEADKLSNDHTRDMKIKQLKETGLKEIQMYKPKLIKSIVKGFYSSENSNIIENIDYLIDEYYKVLLLENYLKDDYSFKSYHAKYHECDTVFYYMSTRDIDIWFECGVLTKYLAFMKGKTLVELNDGFFQLSRDFITAIDSIMYDKKHKEET